MYDILSIGNASIDVILQSDQFKVYKDRRFPTGFAESFSFGSKVHVDDLFLGVGGGALNAAITFARQGLKTGFVGKIGTDNNSQQLIDKMKAESISTTHVIQDKLCKTSYSVILLDKSGERTVLTYRDMKATIPKSTFDSDFPVVSWFYITSLHGDLKLLEHIVRFAKKNRIKVAINPGTHELKQTKFRDLLGYFDVLLMNNEEAHLLGHGHNKASDNIFRIFNGLTKAIIVITNGNRGAAVSDGRTIYYIPGVDVKVIDRLGAGDAFGSGFITGLIKSSGDISSALRLASANAGAVCATMGANDGILLNTSKQPSIKITKHTI